MFKCVASALLFALFVAGSSADTLKACFEENSNKNYDNFLTDLLNEQINVELTAQYSYLRLAHLFQQPHLYYPKFADFFREKSLEEMAHAEDFMNYQTQRGVERSETFDFSTVPTVKACKNIDSLYDGFKCAQDLEISVTKALTSLVSKVSNINYNVQRKSGASTVTYNEDLRTGQAALVTIGDVTTSLKAATEDDETPVSDCNGLKFDYIELSEHISHEYLGHQIIDTKILANAVATLARCAKTTGVYQKSDTVKPIEVFHNTCVFAVERLLKLE